MSSFECLQWKEPKPCFVPTCPNTDTKKPGLRFFTVRKELKSRWCRQLRRPCPKRQMFCCADHLNLKEDLDNYEEYVEGARPRLKSTATLKNIPREVEDIASKSANSIPAENADSLVCSIARDKEILDNSVSELLGTDERLELFAVEYSKLPVLWSKDDKDYKNKSARVAALRRLSRALGRSGPDERGRRMARAVDKFLCRLRQEVLSACAEAALRGGADGGSWGAARALLPPWARRAPHSLLALPAPPAKPSAPETEKSKSSKKTKPSTTGADSAATALQPSAALLRRVVRGLRREARGGAGLLARALRCQPADLRALWFTLQRKCINKLRARVWRCDAGPPLTALEWAVIDLVVTYGGPVINMQLHYQHYRPLRGLLSAFHLVQRFQLESEPDQPPPSPDQWLRAAEWYSRDPARASLSAVVLQSRWHELRADTRRRLRAAWRRRDQPESATEKVLALHEAIARRYPHVVTGSFPTWSDMRRSNQLAPPTNERGPAPGETARTVTSDSDSEGSEDDGVLVIDEGQTNHNKTKSQKSHSKAKKSKKSKKPGSKPKDSLIASLEISDSDDDDDDSKSRNAKPKAKDLPIINSEVSDSNFELKIDERDESNVVEELRKLNPRALQTTIVFASDDDASDDASKVNTQDNDTEHIERPNENKAEDKREPIEEDAHAESKKPSVKTVNDHNANESHTSGKKTKRSDSSDSNDEVLVIDDGSDNVSDDFKTGDQITALIEEEMFRSTSNSSKDEVKSRVNTPVEKLNEKDSSKANVPCHQNPLLSQLLTSKQDDVIKRYQEIKIKEKLKSLAAVSAKLIFNAVTTSKVEERPAEVKKEVSEESAGDSEEENGFEGGIDPKLLMIPVVLLTKIDDPPKTPPSPIPELPEPAKLTPKSTANKIHIQMLSTLSENFFSIKRNIEQLKECKPCVVEMVKLEERRRSRVSKRVELPDIEEVRRNNKRMLTAQVAPLAQQKSAAKKDADSEGSEGAPSLEDLQRLLDDFAGARPAHAECKNRNSDAESQGRCSCGYGRCLATALAAPPASPAAAQLQARILLRAANRAKQENITVKDHKRFKSRKKKPEPLPPPPPARRPRSPYDPERAAREWLREKNVAAEKFGVKPRCFKKKPPTNTALDAATITPLPTPLATPAAAPVPPSPSADQATLTLNKNLNTDLQKSNPVTPLPTTPRITVAPIQAPNGVTFLPLTEENLLRQAQDRPIYKLNPDLFNIDAVADINKKLEDFSPVITNVLSLARGSKPNAPNTSSKTEERVIRIEQPNYALNNGRLKKNTVPKIVVTKSQLKTLSVHPGPSETRSVLNPDESESAKAIKAPTWHRVPTTTVGTAKPANQTDATDLQIVTSAVRGSNVSQASLPLNSVYSGPPLANTPPWLVSSMPSSAIVVGPPSSISQTTFENLPLPFNLNPNVLQVNSVQAGPSQQPMLSAVNMGSHLQLMLTPQQINSLQPGQQIAVVQSGQQVPTMLNWNALQNSPNTNASPTQGIQDRPGTVLRVQASPRGALRSPQMGVLLTDEQFSSLKPVPPGVSQAPPRIMVRAGPSAEKRTLSVADDIFNELDWPGLEPPSVDASAWVATRDRSNLAVLAAPRGCWCVAKHIVLCEARVLPPLRAVYALSPLQRLIIQEENSEGPSPAKQNKPGEPARPWLKVKAFAKMTDDGAKQASQPSQPLQPASRLTAPAHVALGDQLYLKLSDSPLAYAKVLTPVQGARECTAALLQGAPLYLYSPYTATLAPLTGELDPKSVTIVLTGPAEMSDALGALALVLNPSKPTKPENLITKRIFPKRPSKPQKKPVTAPKVLNVQSSNDVAVEAVRVASDPDKSTYHLILNHLQSGSVTHGAKGATQGAKRVTQGAKEARVLGGVIDLSSDEELSV